jgi:Tat protein translocase TatB subunit
MLRAMFGMGGTEILVILIVALLFLGPDKLPEAAKQISKGIRDIKKQSRVLQQTIEDDENIGGAIRDLRSALRGEEAPIRPPKPKQIEAVATPDAVPAIGAAAAAIAGNAADDDAATAAHAFADGVVGSGDASAARIGETDATAGGQTASAGADTADAATAGAATTTGGAATSAAAPPVEALDTTGASFEGDPVHMASHTAPAGAAPASNGGQAAPAKITLPPTAGESDGAATPDAAELAALVKPAPNTIPRGSAPAGSSDPSEPKHG